MKVIKIKNCSECPLLQHKYHELICKPRGLVLTKPDSGFQGWCPLEDYKESEANNENDSINAE